MTLDHPKICIMSHAIILFLLLFHSVLEWDKDEYLSRFLMALLLVPLIRILSFSLPYVHFNLVSWFIIVSVPIFIAILTIMWLQGLRPKDVGLFRPKLTLRRMPIAAGVILVAIPIGVTEYFILKPNALPGLEATDFISAVLIFIICTGFLEELTFRGVLQYNAVRLFGK
jgi:membrane protease YdiL (CAAX protease family)